MTEVDAALEQLSHGDDGSHKPVFSCPAREAGHVPVVCRRSGAAPPSRATDREAASHLALLAAGRWVAGERVNSAAQAEDLRDRFPSLLDVGRARGINRDRRAVTSGGLSTDGVLLW
ncbi:hypothetical protein GCM10009678_08970 [Actinomadura kijaniata]